MKKIFFLTLMITAFVASACDKYAKDKYGTRTSLYIDNKTDMDIEVVYVRAEDAATVRHTIGQGKEVLFFAIESFDGITDMPDLYDTAYVYYANTILIDSIRGKGLLISDNFINIPEATYKNKHTTYRKDVFTIDNDYVNRGN